VTLVEPEEESVAAAQDGESPADHWRGLGELIDLATERLTAPVEGVHHAIAGRWFGLAGATAVPIHRAYEMSTGLGYGSVRTAGSLLGAALGVSADATGERFGPLFRSPVGSGIRAVANAVWGDELERRESRLRLQLELRDETGMPIVPDSGGLARAYPSATGRLVVLLHGWGETEVCWQRTDSSESDSALGRVLEADGLTPLSVRYNTGRHVSDNGEALAIVLEEAVRHWPVPVEQVAVVGHSMGGLVARSAISAGRDGDHRWARTVRHVVTLGAPHLGLPIEKGLNALAWGLKMVPESRPIGEFLDQRSVGIKDLRFGSVAEDDWLGFDPDALLRDVVGEVPPSEGVDHHFVAAAVTSDPAHPIGLLLGDLVVRTGSGTGRGARRSIDATNVRVLGGRRHPHLVSDPAVHQQILDWIAST